MVFGKIEIIWREIITLKWLLVFSFTSSALPFIGFKIINDKIEDNQTLSA